MPTYTVRIAGDDYDTTVEDGRSLDQMVTSYIEHKQLRLTGPFRLPGNRVIEGQITVLYPHLISISG